MRFYLGYLLRAGNPANQRCNPELMRFLGEIIHYINIFAETYKMLRTIEKYTLTNSNSNSDLVVSMF